MKTRVGHSGAVSFERRGAAAQGQPPTARSATPSADLVPRFAETTAVPEDERLRSRAGRGLLLVEGLVIGVLGGVALAWSMGFTRFSPDGTPMLGLKVTPSHAGLLLVVGTLALLACLGRRTALIFTVVTACGWAVLTVACALGVAHHAPGVLGFDPGDSFLYGGLSAYNLVTALVLGLAVFKYNRSSSTTGGTS
jgi:hypothetical protein